MTLSALAPLAEQLVAEFGHVVPPTLIRTSVATATASRAPGDEGSAAGTARADVEALVDAVARRTSAESVSA